MTVGIVVVSHSEKIADGVVELAAQMAENVAIIAAGGTDDGRIGTSFDRVSAALARAESGDGVVVLCDLGSAVLTAETALDFLDDDERDRIVIADAPLVEGTVAAAVAAATGSDRAGVAAAAGTANGQERSGPSPSNEPAEDPDAPASDGPYTRSVDLVNRDGLHARPAAEFVKLASRFDVPVSVNGKDAKSLLAIMGLGLTVGTTVELSTPDPGGREAVDALADLVRSGFGEV
ncbi:phosphocarrier protein HPr /dihydroxyacetone kinase DhaM subunit [Labedella gwakjiensis]|uniref:Phosphocarrier protein HPr n=1 Tax=Labedella gwakjiensis TaxID=390269 RepID=A0A2P8H029_9MICO|nr:dihydroxyacetone kinase phosphoryl donor subunit DhaM [Labedella gwakjiensis]PSL39585.1 phosphocarrier protein HPr /dihydroxyacetone kinase DhaM subunit [Labedella gwakjiensis]RUQ86020.1 HPr family phosphocarrier protein [Labedella gwakjiensis]